MRLKSRVPSRNSAATIIEKSPMDEQRAVGDRALARGADHRAHAQDRDERDGRDAAREHRADDAGRLAVGVGLPGVHGRQPHLRAVADEQQHPGDQHPRPRQARALRGERDEGEVAAPAAVQRRVAEAERAEQRQRDAGAADEQVLPRRLEGARGAVEVEQRHRRERDRLGRDPEQPEVARLEPGAQQPQDREQRRDEHAVGPLDAASAGTARRTRRRRGTAATPWAAPPAPGGRSRATRRAPSPAGRGRPGRDSTTCARPTTGSSRAACGAPPQGRDHGARERDEDEREDVIRGAR